MNYYITTLDIKKLIQDIDKAKKVKSVNFLLMNNNTLKTICKSGYFVDHIEKTFNKGRTVEVFIKFENVPIAITWYLDDGEVEII